MKDGGCFLQGQGSGHIYTISCLILPHHGRSIAHVLLP